MSRSPSTVLVIDDFDASSTRSSFFAFHGSGWSTSRDSNSGYMFGSATKTGSEGNSSFEVTFIGTALSVYGRLACLTTDRANCTCDVSLQDDTLSFSLIAPDPNVNQTELFHTQNIANGNHTISVANCQGFDSLTIDYAGATIPVDAALSPGRQRIGVQNGVRDGIAYEGHWALADSGWGGNVMRTPTPGSSMSFTFVGTEIQVIGVWGHHDSTGRITLATVIDNVTISPSAHFDAVKGGPILPYYTFFEQTAIPQAQPGSDQHTINVTVAGLSGEQVFQFAQFIYTPTVPSLENEAHLVPSQFVRASTSSSILASPTSSSDPGGLQHSSSTNNLAGPVAGGAVGGAAAVLLVVLIVFLWRRKKQEKSKDVAAPTSAEYGGVTSSGPAAITPLSLPSSPSNFYYARKAHTGAFGSAMRSESPRRLGIDLESKPYSHAPVGTATRDAPTYARGSTGFLDGPGGARSSPAPASLPASFPHRSAGGTSIRPLDVDPPSYDDLLSSRTGWS